MFFNTFIKTLRKVTHKKFNILNITKATNKVIPSYLAFTHHIWLLPIIFGYYPSYMAITHHIWLIPIITLIYHTLWLSSQWSSWAKIKNRIRNSSWIRITIRIRIVKKADKQFCLDQSLSYDFDTSGFCKFSLNEMILYTH